MSTEDSESPSRATDHLADVREAIALVPGEDSTSSCGCEWRRVAQRTFCYHGVWVSGDVLTRFCAYHAWYHEQPLEVQREVSRQDRSRHRGTENRT